MASQTDSPLGPEHLDQINEALMKLEAARRQIVLAKAAGIDTTTQEADLQATQAQLQKIKQVYFPGR